MQPGVVKHLGDFSVDPSLPAPRRSIWSTGFEYTGGPDRAAKLELAVTSYCGGWKMKMQRCAAQLPNCGVLMRIEPTGHLDVDYIRWLKDWPESFVGNMLTMFVRSTRRKGVLRNGLMKFAFVKPGLLEDVKSRKLAHDERELPVSLEGQAHDCGREPDRVAGQPRGGR